MPYYKFGQNDIFHNRIETYPEVSFILYNNEVFYKNTGEVTGAFTSNVGHVPVGYISLYELNVDRPSGQLIYPFITKDGSLTSFSTTTTSKFNSDFAFGETIVGSYPLSASITSTRYASGASRPKIKALRNALDSYEILNSAYAYSSSAGNKETQELRLISVPSIFYGSSIKKGSVSLKFYVSGSEIAELKDDKKNGQLRQVNDTVGIVAYSDLYAYYKFDDTLSDGDWDTTDVLLDSMGSYNATPGGNDIEQGVGKFVSASAFGPQANADYFKMNSIPITGSITPGGGFSVSCWVKKAVDSSGNNDDVTVVGCKNSLVAWRLYYADWNQNKATWYVRDVGGNTRYYTSSVSSTTDDWLHFVGTYQANTEPKLYVNGKLQSDAGIQVKIGATMGELSSATARLRIGGDFTSDDHMSGSLDDLRLYKKVLSEHEIKKIYDASSAGSEILASSGSVAGVVMYDQGFVILTGSWDLAEHTEGYYNHPTLTKPRWIDFGTLNQYTTGSAFKMEFSGTNYVPVTTMMAHAPRGELNYSSNPTFVKYGENIGGTTSSAPNVYIESDGVSMANVVSSSYAGVDASFQKTTFINYVGIYDESKNLIAIAKLANPVRKREEDDFTFKLKLDF
tara:strand:+ start:438 stop:2306 length:1869 start_codon:yes stop_codon:yes gene_type:complete